MEKKKKIRKDSASRPRAKEASASAKPANEVTPSPIGTSVPQGQWDMPAGFRPDGKLATLKEVVDPKVPTLSLAEINPEQRADLVAKRIELQPNYQIAMIPAGIIDKDRAIAEVKSQSKVGRALTEIEQRVINNLIERATKTTSQTS
jgi:hypothetical protein